jgi:hypothetical protein
MLRRGPLAIALLILRLVRLVFASTFSPDTTQKDTSGAPARLEDTSDFFIVRMFLPFFL